MLEWRAKLLLIVTCPYLVTLGTCAVVIASMKQPENKLQLAVSRYKSNFRPNNHLSNKGVKLKINSL